MATDGPTPPPMDQEIFQNGELIVVVSNVPSNAMEQWVKKVANKSGQRVDWHFIGGWANVKALGDIEKVKQAARKLAKELPNVNFYWQ
jgi:hypothetical protein